jgi:DNA-binding LytR/AlgR family response regulator
MHHRQRKLHGNSLMSDRVVSEASVSFIPDSASGATDLPGDLPRAPRRLAVSRVNEGAEGLMILRTTTGLRFEPVADIEWLEADANYAIFHIRGEQVRVRMTLNELERTLDTQRFLRISRSTIINLSHARQAVSQGNGQYVFEMRAGHHLVSSRCRRAAIKGLSASASRW